MKALVPMVSIAMLLVGCASQRVDTRTLNDLSGVELYQRMCSSCHGVQARGDGPVAPLMKIAVPDLTQLARREGGEFPAPDVARTIDGRFERSAHGPRDMPVWGWQLYDSTSADDPAERARVDATVERLVDYLRSVQVE